MEFNDELEDLVVLLDTDRNRMYSDEEFEILEDLITIEDEGIMGISHKLQQRDFDEYVSSLRKDTSILPQTFCRIKRNIKLLDSCRPLTVQVVDCKKFKIFYNNKLAVNLKTRENLDDRFKEILSDKDNDISDDDTIEIDADIAADDEMEDLIKIDHVEQKNQLNVDHLSLTQQTGVNNINQSTYDRESYLHPNSERYEVDIEKSMNNDNFSKFNSNFGNNNNSSNVFKVCANVNCISMSMQYNSSTCQPNKKIPHYHAGKDLWNSKISNLPTSKDSSCCINSQTKVVNLQNANLCKPINSCLIESQSIGNNVDFTSFVNKTRKENKMNKKHDSSKRNNKTTTKNKDRPHGKSINLLKKTDKNINKHAKSIQLNIQMQKKIADMLVTVKGLKHNYSKKSSKKLLQLTDDAVVCNKSTVVPTQENMTNATSNYISRPQIDDQDNFTNKCPISNMVNNNEIFSNSVRDTDEYIKTQYKSNRNKASTVLLTKFPYNNNHSASYNNNCNNFPDKNTEEESLSKNLLCINFMKPHLQKLAKANESSKSIKIRPIHHYGLSNCMKQKEIGKSCMQENFLRSAMSNTTSIKNNNHYCDKVSINKRMTQGGDTSFGSTYLNNGSVIVNTHPTDIKILQHPIAVAQENAQTNSKKLDQNVQGSKNYVLPCCHTKKEMHKICLFQNEVPQRIPTLSNRQIVEPKLTFSQPVRGITECPNHESIIQNVTELWRIPLMKKSDKDVYQIPTHSVGIEVTHQNCPKRDNKSDNDILKTIEKPTKVENSKNDIQLSRDDEHLKPTASSIKFPKNNPTETLIATHPSPVEGVDIKEQEISSNIVRKAIKEEEARKETKQKEIGDVKPAPSKKLQEPNSSILLDPDPVASTAVQKPEKPNYVNLHRPRAASRKVSKMEYSPPVLPIPTFRRTFDVLAELNLISKYTYRRNPSVIKYATLDQRKILLSRTITKDVEKYARDMNGDC